MVAITLTQLRALSVEFGFDFERAREFLNLNQTKRGRPTKESAASRSQSSSNTVPYNGTTIPSTLTLKELMKPPKSTGSSTTRGKTGYHYYMDEVRDKVQKSRREKTHASGEKAPSFASEVSQRWQAEPESKKQAWNAYAKSQNAKTA